jgi:hypothetical protein
MWAARPLFRLLASFKPSPIPSVILKASQFVLFEPFTKINATELEVAVRGLIKFGLLNHKKVEIEGVAQAVETLAFHPFIREITGIQTL